MKKFLKKLVIMIIISIVISIFLAMAIMQDSDEGKIQYLNHLNYDVSLNEDGSINVVETWDVYVKDTGTLFKNFTLSNYLYGDITDVRVKDLENNRELTQIYQEQYHVGNNLFYALDIGGNVFEIAWGTGMSTSSGNRKYQVSYKIEDVITSYYDCQEFYWKFIEEGKNTIPVKSLTGTITLPQDVENIENLKVWGHGQVNGNIERTSNHSVGFEINNLHPGAMLEVRVVTTEDMFTVSENKERQYHNIDKIIQEETEWSNETNTQSIIVKSILGSIYAIILIIYIVKIIKYRRIQKKENDGIIKKELKYCRDIPREGDSTPNEAVYLYHFEKEKLETSAVQSEMVASTILNLCLKKIITLEIEGKNIYISLIGDGASLKKEEYQVYKLLSEASKGKDRLEISELNDYAKKHYSNYSIYINKMVNETRNELYHMQFIDKKEEKTYRQSKSANMFFNGILCIYVFLLTFTGILHIPSFQMPIDISLAVGWRESLTTFVIGILPLMLVILYSLHLKAKIEDKIAVITQKGYDEKIQWEALKRFLDDYSLLNEKEVPQLAVWEKYLVYATAFGIANKVIDQMKAKYPTVFLEDSWDDEMKKNYPIIYFSTNPIYYSTHTIGTSTISMLGQGVSKAYSTSVAEIAAHNASSGSGGGGGFSGGGGRRRWPEAGMGGR